MCNPMSVRPLGILLGTVVAGALGASLGRSGEIPSRFIYTEPHMGTRFKLVLYADDEAAAKDAAKAAFARIAALDQIMSDYKSDSELMRLCAKAGGDPVPVSEDLFTVLTRASEVSKLSDGAFDVTVGPVVREWRKARRTKTMPSPETLAKALELVGYNKVVLDPAMRTVKLTKPGMLLDLGGIAKGYAADEVLALLAKRGIRRALLAAGGDIAVGDPPPNAEGWKIGIAPLEDPDAKPRRFLFLANAAVSTSGDAEQFVEIDGKRYSHIVDPHTGIGLVGRSSATVVTRRGIDADSLTKIAAVLGPEKGLPILDAIDGAAALLVRKTDQGEEVFPSKSWSRLKFHDEPAK